MAQSPKIELLYVELQDCNNNLQRSFTEINKLLALGFPIITASFAALIKTNELLNINSSHIYTLFSLLLGVLAVSFNAIWLQILNFVRYKYSVVLPELYKETDSIRKNYGEYSLSKGAFKTFISAFITQALLLPSAICSLYIAHQSDKESLFLIPATISIIIAIFSTFFCSMAALNTSKAISKK